MNLLRWSSSKSTFAFAKIENIPLRIFLYEDKQFAYQIIDDISEAQDEIDNTTGGVYTDEQLTTLTWYKVRMKDWERRAAAMSGNLKSFIDTALKNPKFA